MGFLPEQNDGIKRKVSSSKHLALSRAEDIWAAIETILYSSGRKLHFKKRGDLPEIRAKQSTRGLVIDSIQSGLIVKYGKVTIPCKYKAKDLWLQDEKKQFLHIWQSQKYRMLMR